jgi:CRISPR-associated protein Cmr2
MQNPDGGDCAFLALSLGPVQTFVRAARTVRDLWTGSYLLSWLTRQAMEPVLAMGAELVFPANPREALSDLRSPCLPNRFLAIVPQKEARELTKTCVDAARHAWSEVAESVRKELYQQLPDPSMDDRADNRWQRQIASFFEMRAVVLPWSDCDHAALVRLLENPPEDLWAGRWRVVMGLLQAERAIRHIPDYPGSMTSEEAVPGKCALLGSYEQMGPGNRNRAQDFWDKARERWAIRGTRLRKGERLCAISLVKRYAWPVYFMPVYFSKEQRLPLRTLRFEDTATVAAAGWLTEEGTDYPALSPERVREQQDNWSGQWLHWPRPDYKDDEDEAAIPQEVWKDIQTKREKQGKAPIYLAILMMDGDRMGQQLMSAGKQRQGQISAALASFARQRVPAIVEEHLGELIYAGGDDVLAVLPTARALACASCLAKAFQENWPAQGTEAATVSAGLAVVHYKEDLRFALDQARRAESEAKSLGRNALVLRVCRRSGEHGSAPCPWEFVATVESWVTAFREGASDRWAYHLKAEAATLEALDAEAVGQEMSRQIRRAEEGTRDRFASLENAYGRYRELWEQRGLPAATVLGHFLALCHGASFLARGRDT